MQATEPPIDDRELAHELRETLGRLVRRLRAEPGPARAAADRARPPRPRGAGERQRPRRRRAHAPAVDGADGRATSRRAGLVSRRPDPADGRRAFVELTPAGLELLHATRARREDWLTDALDRELDAAERALLRRGAGAARPRGGRLRFRRHSHGLHQGRADRGRAAPIRRRGGLLVPYTWRHVLRTTALARLPDGVWPPTSRRLHPPAQRPRRRSSECGYGRRPGSGPAGCASPRR